MKNNPVFWLMWLLPGAAVFASFATLAIALSGADRALPPSYHWEGAGLDADFERARRAVQLGVSATLQVGVRGECVLHLAGSARPDSLRLLLTHSHDVGLDRQILLKAGPAGDYRAPCTAAEAGKWRVALDDDAAKWSLRARVEGGLAQVELLSRSPEGVL